MLIPSGEKTLQNARQSQRVDSMRLKATILPPPPILHPSHLSYELPSKIQTKRRPTQEPAPLLATAAEPASVLTTGPSVEVLWMASVSAQVLATTERAPLLPKMTTNGRPTNPAGATHDLRPCATTASATRPIRRRQFAAWRQLAPLDRRNTACGARKCRNDLRPDHDSNVAAARSGRPPKPWPLEPAPPLPMSACQQTARQAHMLP